MFSYSLFLFHRICRYVETIVIDDQTWCGQAICSENIPVFFAVFQKRNNIPETLKEIILSSNVGKGMLDKSNSSQFFSGSIFTLRI